MAEAETVVEIKPDPPLESVEIALDKPKVEKKDEKIVTADEGVADLRAQVERAKQESAKRLQEAERQIAAARQRALDAETEVAVVKTGAVTTVIDSLQKDKETARRDLKAAHEAGDWDKVADATDRLSQANARIAEAERGKLELEAAAKQPRREPFQPAVQDSVEMIARGMSPSSADWVRRHPEHVVGDRLSDSVMSAHYSALANGLKADTNEYFAYIDRSVAPQRQESQRDERETSRSPTAAPVSRDVAQAPGQQRPGRVRLTPNEVATAKALDVSLEDYARHKRDLIEEGKIGGRLAS